MGALQAVLSVGLLAYLIGCLLNFSAFIRF